MPAVRHDGAIAAPSAAYLPESLRMRRAAKSSTGNASTARTIAAMYLPSASRKTAVKTRTMSSVSVNGRRPAIGAQAGCLPSWGRASATASGCSRFSGWWHAAQCPLPWWTSIGSSCEQISVA